MAVLAYPAPQSRLETTLARLLETNLTLCVFDGFDSGNQH